MATEIKKNVTTETKNGNLLVVREPIKDKSGKQLKTQDGREFFAYVVKGKVRGRDIKVDFVPKDMGGYEPLDIVFDVSTKAELIITNEEMTDNSGKTTHYTSYSVETADEDGLIWKCGVKPQRNSDKDLLNMLFNVINIAV